MNPQGTGTLKRLSLAQKEFITSRHSLTQKLRELTHCRVVFEVVAQQCLPASRRHAHMCRVPEGTKIYARHIHFYHNQKLWLCGHTFMSQATLRTLNWDPAAPIGLFLYQKPGLTRSPIHISETPYNDFPCLGLKECMSHEARCLMRHSTWHHHNQPIHIDEYFTADLLNYLDEHIPGHCITDATE